MKQALQSLINRVDLSESEAVRVMTQIMEGAATPSQIAALIVALRMKGETVEEIAGFAQVMREYALKVPVSTDKVVVDTCGTGGDTLKTFNISTAAALVVASDGRLAVAKHGNRAATSKCGSADVLEALGIKLDIGPERVGACVDTVGIGFLFAQAMHPSFRYAGVPRREIGIRTVFNMLGPLTNPAGASCQLIGVYDDGLCEPLAHVLRKLGSTRAMLVHGLDGLDEVSTLGKTAVSELKDGKVTSYVLDAERDYDLPKATIDELAGFDTAQKNAEALLDVISGDDRGRRRDIVLLNSAAVLRAGGVVEDLRDGIVRSGELIDSGSAVRTLNLLREFTNA